MCSKTQGLKDREVAVANARDARQVDSLPIFIYRLPRGGVNVLGSQSRSQPTIEVHNRCICSSPVGKSVKDCRVAVSESVRLLSVEMRLRIHLRAVKGSDGLTRLTCHMKRPTYIL